VSASTAIATTAIGDQRSSSASLAGASGTCPRAANIDQRAVSPPTYVGRFAPSPTGDLHLGSLVAAVGSYVDARHHGGRWLVRIEDLDRTRVVPGCADRILRALESFGLTWDGAILWQSRRLELYRAALATLASLGRTFPCSCSRRELAGNTETGYPGTCRSGPSGKGPTALRLRIDDSQLVCFEDRAQGSYARRLRELGDFVVRRKDGVPSYQLAVVVDDADQHVSDIVRGADLLDSTPWQIVLQDALGLARPRYAHLPLVVEADGSKLSKSRRSLAVANTGSGAPVASALGLLNHPPPPDLEQAGPDRLLQWAIASWNLDAFHACRTVPVPAHFPDFAADFSQ